MVGVHGIMGPALKHVVVEFGLAEDPVRDHIDGVVGEHVVEIRKVLTIVSLGIVQV